jgi:hypothetical protein
LVCASEQCVSRRARPVRIVGHEMRVRPQRDRRVRVTERGGNCADDPEWTAALRDAFIVATR